MYFREPALPRDHDLELIGIATRIASVCILRKRADRVLRRSQRQLSLIYDNVADGIFLVEVLPDFRYRFASVNRAFLSLYGFRIEQVMGNDVEKVLPPSTHQLVLSNYRQAIQEKRSIEWEQAVIHREDKKTISITINPVFDERGVCSHLVGNVHELSRAEGS